MSRADLEAIAEVLEGTDIMVLSDEIYAELTYGGKHVSPANIPALKERIIVVNGFSKSYSMTGWRLGYTAAPAEVTAQLTKLHQFSIMCAPTASQYAALEALQEGDKDIERMRASYDSRRKLLLEGIRDIGLDCFEPRGAFYLFPNVAKLGLSSDEFCLRFLREFEVAVISGSAFGAGGDGHVRMCYAASEDDLSEALKRLRAFAATL
jgi:aminotransferase